MALKQGTLIFFLISDTWDNVANWPRRQDGKTREVPHREQSRYERRQEGREDETRKKKEGKKEKRQEERRKKKDERRKK